MTGGLRLVLNGNWSADGFVTSWTGSWRTIGEYGTAIWDGETAPRVEAGPGRSVASTPVEPKVMAQDRFTGLADALQEFVVALRTGKPPQGECHDNLLSLAMCHAAVESARTRTPVPIRGTTLIGRRRSAHDEDVAGGAMDDLRTDRPQQDALEAVEASAADDDEVGVLCCFDDHRAGIALALDRLGVDAAFG
jgi:hypothetical protein